MTKTRAKRGRRPEADAVTSVSLSLDASHVQMADAVAEDMGRAFEGLQQSRGDVLRTAIARGLKSMRAELDELLTKR
jgi:hypothetical protein